MNWTAQHFSGYRIPLFGALAAATTAAAISVWAFWSLELKWAIFVVLGLMAPFVMAIVPDRKKLLLVTLVFIFPLNADVNLMYHASPGGADAFTIGLSDILVLLLLGHVLSEKAASKRQGDLQFFPAVMLPSLGIFAAALISLTAAQDLLWSAFDLLNFAKVMLFFFVLANSMTSRDDIALVLKTLFFSVIVQSVLVLLMTNNPGILQFLQKFGLGAPGHMLSFEMEVANVSRPGGTIGHVNHLARYLGLLLPLAIVQMLVEKKGPFFILSAVTTFIGSAALIYTLTRSSWAGLFVAILVMIPMMFAKRIISFRSLGRMALMMFAFVVIIFIYRESIWERLTGNDLGSASTRITTAKVAVDIIKDYPFFGVGVNNYGAKLDEYWIAEDTFTRRAAVHNTYLLYAAEIGLIGFLMYIALLFSFFKRIRTAAFGNDRFLIAIAVGVMGGFFTFLVTALTDKSYKENFSLLLVFWTLMALIEAVIRVNNKMQHDVYMTFPQERA